MKRPTCFVMVLAAILAAGPVSAGLDDGLVAHYEFEGNALDSANDNDGTASGGVSYVTGVKGLAAQFDGTSGYIAVPSDNIRSLDVFSVALWARIIDLPVGQATIVIHDRQNLDAWPNKHFDFRCYGGGQLDSGWESSSGDNRTIQHPTYASTYGDAWVHLVLTRDAAGNGTLWIDGQPYGTTAGSVATDNPDDFMIGAVRETGAAGSEVYFFDGLVDDVRIYSRVLTPVEIRILSGQGIPGIGTWSAVVVGLLMMGGAVLMIRRSARSAAKA